VRAAGLAAAAALALASGCGHAPGPASSRAAGFTGQGGQAGAVEVGMASFYADSLRGHRTASGAPYDPAVLTCAHRSAPFGTRLRVTELSRGRSVVVTVNDRGPFVSGRVIDLSRAAAAALGIVERGVARVRVERLER